MGQNAIKPLIEFIREVENEFNHVLKDVEFKVLAFSSLSDKVKKLIKNRIYFEKGKRRNFAEDWDYNIRKLQEV